MFKKSFVGLFCLLMINNKAQDKILFKSYSNVSVNAGMINVDKDIDVISDNNKTIISMYSSGTKHIECYYNDSVTFIHIEGFKKNVTGHEKFSDVLCSKASIAEVKAENEKLENKSFKSKIENVTTTFEKETKVFLGYNCKKAIISYDLNTMGMSVKNTTEIWYTEDVKMNNSKQLELSQTSTQSLENLSDLLNAFAKINGTIMFNKTKSNIQVANEVITETTLLKKNPTKEELDKELTLDLSMCKEFISYKKFAKTLAKRANSQNQMQQNPHR